MKAHSLHRLLASLYSKPHLASKSTLESVLTYLNSRNAGLMTFPEDSEDADEDLQPDLDGESGVGVITIRGPLTYRSTGWEAYCGGFSYEMLLDQVEDLIESGVTTIVIDADSGGGEAYACFETTDEMRRMADDAGVKIYGYVDGSACSAMYAILCACDEVIVNPFGEVGSIGCVICLYNDSKNLEQEGYQRIFVTDGTEKVPFDEDGSFKKEFLNDLQDKVAELGGAFREHVSKYTGLSIQALKDTQAKVYTANDALSMGLVNKIMTRSDFVKYVLDKQNGASTND